MRIVKETRKPFALVARVGESKRAELVRPLQEVAEWRIERDVLTPISGSVGSGGDGAVEVAAFIKTQGAGHGVPYAVLCPALGVSAAWHYRWRHGDVSLRRKRRAAVARWWRTSRPPGWRISKNTVADSMRVSSW